MMNKITISVEELPQGAYVLTLHTEDGTVKSGKFIKH